MRNPFAKPHTLGQWLLGSGCWTVACVGGDILFYLLLSLMTDAGWQNIPMFYIIPASYILVWVQALAGRPVLLRSKGEAPAILWWTAFWWRLILKLLLIAAPLLLLLYMLLNLDVTPHFG